MSPIFEDDCFVIWACNVKSRRVLIRLQLFRCLLYFVAMGYSVNLVARPIPGDYAPILLTIIRLVCCAWGFHFRAVGHTCDQGGRVAERKVGRKPARRGVRAERRGGRRLKN